MICQHWVGALKVGVKGVRISEKEVDLWLPQGPPEGAEMIGQDEWEDPTVFPGLLKARAKIGPLRATVTLNAVYTGRVEYWRK